MMYAKACPVKRNVLRLRFSDTGIWIPRFRRGGNALKSGGNAAVKEENVQQNVEDFNKKCEGV